MLATRLKTNPKDFPVFLNKQFPGRFGDCPRRTISTMFDQVSCKRLLFLSSSVIKVS